MNVTSRGFLLAQLGRLKGTQKQRDALKIREETLSPAQNELPIQMPSEVEVTHNEDIKNMTPESEDGDFSSGSGELYEPSEREDEIATETETQHMVLSRVDQSETITRKRKGQGDRNQWKRQKNAQLRLKGKAYIGFKKNESGKYEQNENIEEKSLRSRCDGHPLKKPSKRGGPKHKFECAAISDEDRQSIFNTFWNLSTWEAKKVFVAGCVALASPKYRKNTTRDDSKKKVSFKFHLKVNEGVNNIVKKHVCKKMFISTLCIGEKSLRSWMLEGESATNISRAAPPTQTEETIHSGTSSEVSDLEKFLLLLPKVESHYCRSSTTKLYLEPTWNSFRHMHRHYIEKCKTENRKTVSWKKFHDVVKKLNIDIYTPKKDQCNECTMYKVGNLEKEIYEKHVQKKNQARSEKDKDKDLSMVSPNNSIQSYTVDLQAVLLSPRLNAAANYYKTKLKVHNLTYYNLCSKDVLCYVWHEASGGLESDVFASIATNFFQKEINEKKMKQLIIWSDGCGYQNRNVKLSNALLELSIKNNIVIEQKYLEVGHTQMEVDSIHASIEKRLGKRREVYVPADYIPIIKEARLHPKPYETVYCHHTDFFKFEPIFYQSIRPGNKVGDPCVNDVVAYQYTSAGIINYKLDFQDDWITLPVRPKRVDNLPEHDSLYTGPCLIESTKYAHLQELKKVIPSDYHSFYDTLLHK